jgi:hypothetical protein
MQQPMMTNQGGYNRPPSASKNAPVATPYQGRVPSGVPQGAPQGYQYEYNTYGSPNLGYQDGQNLGAQG